MSIVADLTRHEEDGGREENPQPEQTTDRTVANTGSSAVIRWRQILPC